MASVAVALWLAAPAHAVETAVIVLDEVDLERFAERGAVGLMVPGSGSEVSRRGAEAALVERFEQGLADSVGIRTVPTAARCIDSAASLPALLRHYRLLCGPLEWS